MSTVIGIGAEKNATKKVDDSKEVTKLNKQIVDLTEDKKKLEEELANANESIYTLTTDKSALEEKLKELEPKSEDPAINEEDSEGKDSKKQLKKMNRR